MLSMIVKGTTCFDVQTTQGSLKNKFLDLQRKLSHNFGRIDFFLSGHENPSEQTFIVMARKNFNVSHCADHSIHIARGRGPSRSLSLKKVHHSFHSLKRSYE